MTDVTRLVEARWSAWASTFDEEPDHGLRDPAVRAAWDARVRAWLPPEACDVVDLGCGTGSLAVLVAAQGHRVAGIDLSPSMVDLARRKAAVLDLEVAFEVGDAGAPALAPGSVDFVLVRHVTWTLPDPRAALRRWVELVRPGGRVVLIEGRWQTTGEGADPEPGDVALDSALPWSGGVAATTLRAEVAPLVTRVEVQDLTGDDDLWGRPVADERYALVADVGRARG